MRTPTKVGRAAGLLLLCAFALAACGSSEDTELRGLQRLPLPDVGDVSLPDATANGTDFTFTADDGKVLLVHFGYTSCPDVCPTTLVDVRAALGQLGDDADRIDLAMATIDPARDTGELLTGYVQTFVPGSHALVTTDDARLARAADAFGVSYGVELDDDGKPEVFHSGFLYAVDDQGALQVSWPFPTPPEDYAHDLRILLKAT